MFYSYCRLLLVILFLLGSFGRSRAQQDSINLNALIEKTAKLSNDRPIEKAYLHFDKPYYSLGDTIWFKGYLTIDQHQPSPLSKILYADIITSRDSIVETLKLPVVNGTCAGNFTLSPMQYNQGNYRIRAYTNWMFNFKDDYFFYKNIAVGDAVEKELITHASFLSSTDKNTKQAVKVVFKDQDGRVLAAKKVSWKINMGYETILKGRAETDANGVLLLTVPENKKLQLSTAVLNTALELSSQRTLPSSFPLTKLSGAKDVQFLPEGGELINEVPCRVAFKAIKADGLGIELKGNITDNLGNTLAEFASQHLGMGSFTLTPEPNKIYTANIIFSDGTKTSIKLPAAAASGITLKVNSADQENLFIKILCSSEFLEKNRNKSFYLISRTSGIVNYGAQLKLQSQAFSASMPKNKFPSGILQITLLSSSGEVLRERLSFINNQDVLELSLKTDKAAYAPRQKVNLLLTAKSGSLPAEGNFSAAVIDETRTPSDESSETTILSSLLLSSDLRGFIEKPNYYFTNTDERKLADLDVLLLTQGYRSVSYKEIITDTYPKLSFLPEQGINISGTLRQSNGMPVFKGNVRLLIPDKSIALSAVTDAEGRFGFKNIVFADSSKVTISALNNVNAKNLIITLDGTAYPSLNANINAAEEVLNIDSTIQTYLSNSKKQYFSSRILQEVVIKSKMLEKKSSHSDYTTFSGLSMMANHEISADRFKGCTNFLQCLQGSAMGLIFIDNNFYISKDYNNGNKTPVQIFIRDMAVDASFLSTVNPIEVESVEIFFKDDLSGINRRFNTNGVLIVNMKEIKKSNMSISELKDLFPAKNTITFLPKGYSKPKQFYQPKYAVSTSVSGKPDLRTTVYWNPLVLTDKNGTVAMEFFNADGKGTYKAVIEGIDKDGKIGRTVYRYTVK